ncbi:hypothetical protein AgCh_025589 [Apium graveolens]
MLLTGLETEHTSLEIYILMRAPVLASPCGIKSKRFGNMCKPLTWAHEDIFLMCLASSQIFNGSWKHCYFKALLLQRENYMNYTRPLDTASQNLNAYREGGKVCFVDYD